MANTYQWSLSIIISLWAASAGASDTHIGQGTPSNALPTSPSLSAMGEPCNPQVLSAVYANMLRIQSHRNITEFKIPADSDEARRNLELVPLYLELIHWRRTPAPTVAEMNQLVGSFVAEGNKPYIELKFSAPFPKTVRYEFSADKNLKLDQAISDSTSLCEKNALEIASHMEATPSTFDSSVVTLPKAVAHSQVNFQNVSDECQAVVKQVYASGGNLASTILKKNVVPLAAWNAQNSSPDHDLMFFHYTSAEAAFAQITHAEIKDRGQAQLQTFSDRGYEKIYNYLYQTHSGPYKKLHYLAADPLTSNGYGNYRVIFELDPRTPVFDLLTIDKSVLPKIWKELQKRYPALKKCNQEQDSDLIQYLSAEDSGAGLIAYYRSDLRKSTWYQLLNPRFITGTYGERVK